MAEGRPKRTFSRMEAFSRRLFWKTKETVFIRVSLSICRASTPPMRTTPFWGSKYRARMIARVLFPPPEGPTKATVRPAGMVRERSRITSCSPS